MKILVAVKRVVDPYVKIRVKMDQSGIDTQNVKMAINPFDAIALEEAIRLMEKNLVSEVIAVTIGNSSCQETLRQALALGATKATLVETEEEWGSLNIAKILQAITIKEQPDLILMGKQSIDGDNNQTPQMLSSLLNWPQATFASELLMEGNTLQVTREIDGGLETLTMQLPAIVSTDLRLNEPRYASLPNIMRAKTKPLSIIPLSDLNLPLKKHKEILKVVPPPVRKAGIKVESPEVLIDKLKNEAKVL